MSKSATATAMPVIPRGSRAERVYQTYAEKSILGQPVFSHELLSMLYQRLAKHEITEDDMGWLEMNAGKMQDESLQELSRIFDA